MNIVRTDSPVGDDIGISMSVIYTQEPDNCSRADDYQEITIRTKDGGAGNFFNLKTNENGWSFSKPEEILKIIEDFITRHNLNSTNA